MNTCNMIVKNSISELESITLTLENFFSDHHLSSTVLFDVNLVIEEVFTNIVFYAFNDSREHLINIHVVKKDELLTIQIEDQGIPFNPLEKSEPDLDKPISEREVGGLGIHLVKKMMDHIEYSRKGHKNVLKLYKNISRDQINFMSSAN
jgi:anti-sigma regulatory factor (Ser/Thr protein kinase)